MASPTLISTAGTYYIKSSNGVCNDIEAVVVTITTTPVLTITNPQAVCFPSTVDITAAAVIAGSTGGGTITYHNNAAGTGTLAGASAIATSGIYYIKSTVGNCTDIEAVTVTINATPVLTIVNPAGVCSPATVNITTNTVITGNTNAGTLSYWLDMACTQTLASPTLISTAGTYYIKSSNGVCNDIEAVVVTITTTPVLTINNPLAVCFPSTVDITAAAVIAGSTGGGTITYHNNAAGTGTLAGASAIATSGIYYIKSTVGNCTDIEAVTVTINPSPNLIIVKNPDAVCAPNTVSIIEAALTAGSDFGVYSYFDTDGTTPLLNPSTIGTSGVYYITLTSNGCPTKKPITVTINPLPIVSLDQNGFVCVAIDGQTLPGSSFTLNTGLTVPQYKFVWYNDSVSTTVALTGETNSSLVVNTTGNYRVVVENNATSCKNEASATIVSSLPPDTIQFVTSSYFADDKVITVNVSPVSSYEYQINNGVFQDSNIFTGVNSGINKVVVRDKYGCGQKEDTVRLLDFPKYFTPNGDGFNDTWNISDISEQFNAKIYIFDRYGKLLKQITPTSKGWDGTINTTDLPADDYWFTVEYEEAQINKTFKAHFSLKR